jgi:hypothetical protein
MIRAHRALALLCLAMDEAFARGGSLLLPVERAAGLFARRPADASSESA